MEGELLCVATPIVLCVAIVFLLLAIRFERKTSEHHRLRADTWMNRYFATQRDRR